MSRRMRCVMHLDACLFLEYTIYQSVGSEEEE
jgi:hypothetical protein